MIKEAVELWLECADEAEVARRLADPKIAVKPLAVFACLKLRVLHLKSACSDIGNNAVLLNRSWIDAKALRNFELLDVAEEPNAANVLLLNGVVIMPTSFPKTGALLEERGFRFRRVDVSELQKAERA